MNKPGSCRKQRKWVTGSKREWLDREDGEGVGRMKMKERRWVNMQNADAFCLRRSASTAYRHNGTWYTRR